MNIQIDDYEYLDRKNLVRFESTENTNLIDIDLHGTRATVSVCELLSVATAFKKLKDSED